MSAAANMPFLAVPRDRGDEACAVLSPRAFKVWFHITRMTRGWGREDAIISYADFMRTCGFKKRNQVTAALAELVAKGFIFMACSLKASMHRAGFYGLLDSTGNEWLPVPDERPARKLQLVPNGYQDQYPDVTSTGNEWLPETTPQPAPQAAPDDAIETLIETSIDKEETYAPSARTSESDVQGVDNFVDNQQEEKDLDALAAQREREVKEARLEMHEKERQVRKMMRAGLIGPYLKKVQARADELHAWLAEHPLLEFSDSHAPGDASYPPDADGSPGALLYESAPAPEQAYDEVDAPFYEEPEPPADDSADECSPGALFPEAIPPAKADWFGTVGGWFFDMAHVDARDQQQIGTALGKIKKRGYDDLGDVESRFYRWCQKYAHLKAKGIMHFANNLQKV